MSSPKEDLDKLVKAQKERKGFTRTADKIIWEKKKPTGTIDRLKETQRGL